MDYNTIQSANGKPEPIIVFGQQPNGFLPKNYFVAKIQTARALQKQIGGRIIWFCHDSDSDFRETATILTDKQSGKKVSINFILNNIIQKKFSPLYIKTIKADWQAETTKRLPQYVSKSLNEIFANISASTPAEFCIRMYEAMGLLKQITVIRSSDPELRRQAIDIPQFFVDTIYEGETVRARYKTDHLELHEGGNKYISLPLKPFNKEQVSPTRDTRFIWMQSVLHATHYITGESEQAYLNQTDTVSVKLIPREFILNSQAAYTNFL